VLALNQLIAVLIKMRYAKFCYDHQGEPQGEHLYIKETSESLEELSITNYQLPITNYPLPDIPHLFEKGYIRFESFDVLALN